MDESVAVPWRRMALHEEGTTMRQIFGLGLAALGVLGGMHDGARAAERADGFMGIPRPPDAVSAVTETESVELSPSGDLWKAEGVTVAARHTDVGLTIGLAAPGTPVKYLRLRWNGAPPVSGWKYLGDAWERAYGDLEWRPLDGERVMPWYFLMSDGARTHGYGVLTGPAAMCAWQVDSAGVTLTADVRNGGRGVLLEGRSLDVCTVVSRRGKAGETPFRAATEFGRVMCPNPRLPDHPVYGFNDWYCDYGRNSAESVRYYARFVSRLSPDTKNRPYMVIDDGWQPGQGGGGWSEWDRGNDRFGDMARLARDIRAAGARPGIWVHLLKAQPTQPPAWRIPGKLDILDPSRPAVRAYVKDTISNFQRWGYDLIKHDYSTRDISDGWGTGAGAAPDATWTFYDRSRTTAEILLDHYRDIEEAAGGALVIGCNTVSDLAAGIFPIQRIGDDTSGREWARTLKMGVNALAFRGPQNGGFYAADADCVGLTEPGAIPWELNRQWMDLLARSGTPLFISFKQGSVTPEQEKDIAAALALAARPHQTAEPLDWFETLQPKAWKLDGKRAEFDWTAPTP
jgi:alpha-galactosidase